MLGNHNLFCMCLCFFFYSQMMFVSEWLFFALLSFNAYSLVPGLFILNSHSLHLSASIYFFFVFFVLLSFIFCRNRLPPWICPCPSTTLLSTLSAFCCCDCSSVLYFCPCVFALVTRADYVGLNSFGPHAVCGQGQLWPPHSEHGQSQGREPLMWLGRQGDRAGGKSSIWFLKNDLICHWCERVLCLLPPVLQCHPYISNLKY